MPRCLGLRVVQRNRRHVHSRSRRTLDQAPSRPLPVSTWQPTERRGQGYLCRGGRKCGRRGCTDPRPRRRFLDRIPSPSGSRRHRGHNLPGLTLRSVTSTRRWWLPWRPRVALPARLPAHEAPDQILTQVPKALGQQAGQRKRPVDRPRPPGCPVSPGRGRHSFASREFSARHDRPKYNRRLPPILHLVGRVARELVETIAEQPFIGTRERPLRRITRSLPRPVKDQEAPHNPSIDNHMLNLQRRLARITGSPPHAGQPSRPPCGRRSWYVRPAYRGRSCPTVCHRIDRSCRRDAPSIDRL